MRRRLLLVLTTLIVIGVIALPSLAERQMNKVEWPESTVTARARALHTTLRVADLHADSLLWGRDLATRASRGHVDLPRLREGGVVLQGFGLVTKTPRGLHLDGNDDKSDQIRLLAIASRWPTRTWSSLVERAVYQAERLAALERAEAGHFVIVRTKADLERLLAAHHRDAAVVGGLLGLEGAHALEGQLANLERLYALGLRSVGLAHFFDNEWASSAHGIEKAGLTSDGRTLVRALEDHHVVIDLAHSAPKVIDEVLAIARRPVMVSHTGVAATCKNPRNLTDHQLRAIAKNGGLVGIGYWQVATCGKDPASIARAIAHAVSIMGEDHVALGSDFDGAVTTPFDASGLAYVTDALLSIKLPERTIKKVMGENAITFWSQNLPD